MINFERFELNNGLKVIVHEDITTPLAVVNILYNVGARDEDPEKTGFAHLFEHLMFEGSVNIPVFDKPLEMAGGSNNAFTNNDITNYYDMAPANNIETIFWLESDRMQSLNFDQENLNNQINVVCEEFKEHYLNQPYGDVWLKLCPLAYKVHPYQWSTIGKNLSHIQNATLEDVKDFFFKHYRPNNAIMTVAGNVKTKDIQKLAERWFGEIPAGDIPVRDLPREPLQKQSTNQVIKADVPADAIYKAYHMCARSDMQYHATDLLTDILSTGKSSRLYIELVNRQKLFSQINADITGSLDNGLLIIEGKLSKGTSIQNAEKAIEKEIKKLQTEALAKYELDKVKNKMESSLLFSEMNIFNKAEELAFYELLGDAEGINEEINKYRTVSAKDILAISNDILTAENCSTLYYMAK